MSLSGILTQAGMSNLAVLAMTLGLCRTCENVASRLLGYYVGYRTRRTGSLFCDVVCTRVAPLLQSRHCHLPSCYQSSFTYIKAAMLFSVKVKAETTAAKTKRR